MNQIGWICPVCGRGNAPWNSFCYCRIALPKCQGCGKEFCDNSTTACRQKGQVHCDTPISWMGLKTPSGY